MVASDKNTRRIDEAERARHIAASETAAFATTAGAMLLGVVAGAEAAQHRGEHQPQPPMAIEPALPPAVSHPSSDVPTAATAAGPEQSHDDQHTGAMPAAAPDSAPAVHADATPEPGASTETAPGHAATPAHDLVSSIQVWDFSAGAHQAHAAQDSPGPGAAATPSLPDLGTTVHQLAGTVADLIDTPLAMVSDTIAKLGATVGQLTSSLSDTISHLTDGLTGTVSGLAHAAPVTGVLEPLVTDLLGPASKGIDASDTSQHGAPLFDSAGAIPTALLHPLPLHLGFLGQPTIDGHETHDGAFSALGIHHF
jgi:hypothetical protein